MPQTSQLSLASGPSARRRPVYESTVDRIVGVVHTLTVNATCRQQGRSVLDYLTTVCTATQLGQPVPSLLPATL